MGDLKKKIEALCLTVNIPADDIPLLVSIFMHLTKEDSSSLLDAFYAHHDLFVRFHYLCKKKEAMFLQQNKSEWAQFIEEEKEFLSILEKTQEVTRSYST